jgi:hypothetical protein
MHSVRSIACALTGAIVITGCAAVGLGGGQTEFTSMVLRAEAAPAAEVAAQIRSAGADLVLLSSSQDSSWFAEVAGQTGLTLSGPGQTGGRGLALLTSLEVLGDTALVLPVPGGGEIHMQDALFRIHGDRMVDLMYVRLDEDIEVGAATRTLLEYIATDVGPNVALLLAVESPRPGAADSVALRLRALYPTAWECTEPGRRGDVAPAGFVRLFFGPTARVRCLEARQVAGAGNPVAARLIIAR